MAFTFVPDAFNVYNIGSFEAKTYFAELLRKVQSGAQVNISKNGKPVAILKGVKTAQNQDSLEAHKRIVARSKRLAQAVLQNGEVLMNAKDLMELKDAGRKY
ncbi:MAG: type II toxin-antitoxin system prevent-host-death family antitoxin [Treponema sp.]|nr:type II toxin-antitoxin system prevent-host-death family antitoxin [Treponema sp.]